MRARVATRSLSCGCGAEHRADRVQGASGADFGAWPDRIEVM